MTFKETFPDQLKMNPLENILKQYYSCLDEALFFSLSNRRRSGLYQVQPVSLILY